MENLTSDDILDFIVENGLLSIPSRTPITIYDKPAPKKTKPKFPYDHPINAYKRSEITDSELCDYLSIDKKELLPYLVKHGVLS